MEALETLIGEFTLTELAQRSGKTVSDIVAFALNEPKQKPTKAPKQKAALAAVVEIKAKQTEDTSEVNTRTPAGRAAYDGTVYAHLKAHKGTWMGAGEIRKACGGTGLQVRTALARLLEDDTIEYQGQARATEYRVK